MITMISILTEITGTPTTGLCLSLAQGLAILAVSPSNWITCPSILSDKRSLTIAILGSTLTCSGGVYILILLLRTTVEALAWSFILTGKGGFST